MQIENHELNELMKEILIPASNKIIEYRFSAESAANCSGRCDGGGCRAMVEEC